MRNPWGRGGDEGHPPPGQGRPGHGPDHGHGRGNPNNGHQPDSLLTQPIVFDEVGREPVDLMAVMADDELINAIAAGRPVPGAGSGFRSDDRITAMLEAWRDEVAVEPVRPLISGTEAEAALRAGRRLASSGPRHAAARRSRHLIPLAGAAAALAVTLSGVALGAHGAEPDDALWSVSKVLFSERAASVEKKVEVENRLQKVKSALVEGRTDDARRELEAVGSDLGDVRAQEGKDQLAERQEFLSQKLEKTPPGMGVNPAELDPSPPDPHNPTTTLPPPTSVSPAPSSTLPPAPGTSGTAPASGPQSSSGGSDSPTTPA